MKRFLVVLLSLAASVPAIAQNYPTKPVSIIVPYATGSSTDLMARGLAARFQESLGQSFIVTSRDGGSVVIGMTALSQSPPDGLTLAYTPLTSITVQPHLVGGLKLGPDAVQPVCGVAENILAIAISTEGPYKSVDDLIRKAKRQEPVNYGSPGPNSIPALGAEDLARNQAISFTHVPFRGDAASLQELAAGRLDFAAIVAVSATPFIASGKVKLIAMMSTRRHPEFPSVPTLTELKYPVAQVSFTGIFAPKDTPKAILDTLEQACSKALTNENLVKLADTSNQIIKYQSRAELERTVREQFKLQGESLKAIGAIK
jgi:tripartite-type tricarboxylate transporter receptor subunit TctC